MKPEELLGKPCPNCGKKVSSTAEYGKVIFHAGENSDYTSACRVQGLEYIIAIPQNLPIHPFLAGLNKCPICQKKLINAFGLEDQDLFIFCHPAPVLYINLQGVMPTPSTDTPCRANKETVEQLLKQFKHG